MKKTILFLVNLILISFLFGCEGDVQKVEIEPSPEPETIFVYSDTCIVTGKNTENQSITFQNIETGLRYTLSYDNLTFFTDKYGNGIVPKQLENGQICDISFYREDKLLKTLDISSEYYSYTDVDSFKFYNMCTRMEYLGNNYDLDENIVVSSGKENIDVREIAEGDVLTVIGYGHTIYSIILTKGHGYVSFEHDDYFVDGFVEIGKDIRKITKDMILTVPEGIYDVRVSKDGTVGVKEVTVGRNQEVSIELGDIEIVKKIGTINMELNPEDASVYVDNVKVENPGKPLELEYGVHEIIVRADGYETIQRFISVGSAETDISFKLTEIKSDDDEDDDDNDTEQNVTNGTDENDSNDNTSTTSDVVNTDTSTDTSSENTDSQTSDKKLVYIDAPTGAEVYLDGNYVGVVPTTFTKTSGTVIVTLRKTGCQTRSYTISLEDPDNDSHYSFSDLLTVETE